MGLAMGDLIFFRGRERQPSVRLGGDALRTADIMLFTGVRYQRMAEEAPNGADGRDAPREGGVRGKRRRKR
jgi:hypothetical protein